MPIPRLNIANKYFCWALILFPVAVMYSFFGIPLSYVITAIGMLLAVISGRTLLLRGASWVIVFFCYMAVIPSLVFFLSTHALGGLIQTGTWLFLLYMMLFNEYVERTYLRRVYGWVLIAAICFFLYQEFIYLLTDSRISGIIPFLDFTYYADSSTEAFSEVQQNANRSSSFFLEPAMFAQFLVPGLAMNMKYTRKNFLCFLGLLIIIVIGRTGTGLFIGAIASVIYLLNWKEGSKAVKFTFYCVIFIVGLIGARYIMTTNYYTYISARTEEFSSDDSSAFVRFFRGYLLLGAMTPAEKLLGVGTKNLVEITQRPGVSAFFGDNDIYMNGVQSVLVGGGVVGLALFFWMLWKIYRQADSTGRYIILLFSIQSLMAASYLSALMLVDLIFALKYKRTCLSKSILTQRMSMMPRHSTLP